MNTNKKLALIIIGTVVMVSGCIDSSPNDSSEYQQLPVGENAWKNAVNINITEQISPSRVNVEAGQTIRWNNNRNETVNVSIDSVERIFSISPGESQNMNPSSGFEYQVLTSEGSVDNGEIVMSD